MLLPLLFGGVAKRRYRQMIEVINQTTPFSAKIVTYDRGWFSSEAITQISLDKLDLPNKELYQLTITANIIHGPLRIDWTRFYFMRAMVDATISLNETQNKWLQRNPDAAPAAVIKIKFKLNGKSTLLVDSPSLTYQGPENNINWHGLKIRSVYSPTYDKIISEINFAGLDVKTKNRNIHLGEITSNYQGNKTSNDTWLGEKSLQCAAFSTTNENNRTIAFDNLHIHNLITANDRDRVNVATIIDIANLNINGASYNQNKLDLETNNIDPSWLVRLWQQLISNRILYSPAGTLFDTLVAILSNGSEFNVKQLDTITPWGRLLANAKIAFVNQTNNIGIFAVLASSTISTSIKVEPALALHLIEKFYQNMPLKPTDNPKKQAAVSLANWQKSGKIVASNEDPYLHLTIDYKDNRPFINGQQLVLTFKP